MAWAMTFTVNYGEKRKEITNTKEEEERRNDSALTSSFLLVVAFTPGAIFFLKKIVSEHFSVKR